MTKIIKVTIQKKDGLYVSTSKITNEFLFVHEAIGVTINETPNIIKTFYKERYNINVLLNEIEREKIITNKKRQLILTYDIKVKKYDGSIISLREGMNKLNLIGKSNRKFFEKYLNDKMVKKLVSLRRGNIIIKEDFSGLHKLYINYRTCRITHTIKTPGLTRIARSDINVNDENDSREYEKYILSIIKNSLKELRNEKKIN